MNERHLAKAVCHWGCNGIRFFAAEGRRVSGAASESFVQMFNGDVPSKIRKIVERDQPDFLRFPEIRRTDEHVAEDRRLFGGAVLKASLLAQLRGRFVIIRHKDDQRGEWNIPGGLVELEESVEDAAVREMREESGLDVELVRALVVIVSKITAPRERSLDYFRVIFLAKVTGGRLEALDKGEIAEARLASGKEIMKLVSEGKFQRMPAEIEKMVVAGLQKLS